MVKIVHDFEKMNSVHQTKLSEKQNNQSSR